VRTKFLATLGLVALLSAASAFAQGPPAAPQGRGGAPAQPGGPPAGARGMQAKPLRATIPFTFHAGDKVLPPGEYDFVYNTSARWGINLRVVAPDGSWNVLVEVLTRLPGAVHTTPKDAHVVFDKVANTYFLSSLWLPNIDGYLVRITMENVEHTIVDVPM
jgi:hypothetical protein